MNIVPVSCIESQKIKRISAGVVILRQENSRWHALILRAWNHWDFPKGNVEPGETLIQAALREVQEETGITQLDFKWGSSLARTSLYSKDKVAYYALACTTCQEVQLNPNPMTGIREHDEYQWVLLEDLAHILSPRLHPILDWVQAHLEKGTAIAEYTALSQNS